MSRNDEKPCDPVTLVTREIMEKRRAITVEIEHVYTSLKAVNLYTLLVTPVGPQIRFF